MKNIKPQKLPEHLCIKRGRLGNCNEAITLFWTGSGIELCVKGSYLSIDMEAGYENYDLWIDVVIDGALVQKRMLDPGMNKVTVFRGMDPDTVKHVMILRDTQAMPADIKSYIDIVNISYEGELTEVPSCRWNFEVIGDSITSGEGLCGHRELMDWVPYCFSVWDSYWNITAREMNAKVSVLSQSGWGVYCSYDSNPKEALPLYYDRVCGILSDQEDRKRGCRNVFQPDHTENTMTDAVIINLGTNDANGLLQYGTKEEFEEAALHFLNQVRKMHPRAYIVWLYGMLGNPLQKEIKTAIDKFNMSNDNPQKPAYAIWVDETTYDEIGSREHPGKAAHSKTDKKLIAFLDNLLI